MPSDLASLTLPELAIAAASGAGREAVEQELARRAALSRAALSPAVPAQRPAQLPLVPVLDNKMRAAGERDSDA